MTPKEHPEVAAKMEKMFQTLALQGAWDIDLDWGMAQIAQYQHELELVAAGVPYAELGIGERRKASMPQVLTFASDGLRTRVVFNPENLSSTDEIEPGSIALLKLQGVMRTNDGMSSRGINSLITDLNAAYDNPHISGILFEVNSGGGESMAGSMLQNALADSPKAVVSYYHLMASAAVRATLTTDEIIAAGDGAMAGSIGTYVTLDKWFAQYYSRYYEDLYASKSTNKNRSFREYLKGNNEPMQQEIDRHNDQFLAEVAKYRQLRGDVNHTLSGEMFSATDAKRRGLSDGTGTFNYALSRLKANISRRKKI